MPLFIQYILVVIGLLFGGGYAYGQLKQGRNQSSLDNDNIYKGRIEALELNDRTKSDQIERLTLEVKKLRDDNEEANRKLLDAMNILQNRNPELVKFMSDGSAYMLQTAPVLDTLKRFLDKQVI